MVNYSKLHIRKRISVLFLVVVFLMLGLFLRLVWVQVINGDKFKEQALNQRLTEMNIEPHRGQILDANGSLLATSRTVQTVTANPEEIKNPRETAKKLANVLTLSEDEIYRRITKRAINVYVERKIPDEVARIINEMDLSGIVLIDESKRNYPNQELASHILGFAGVDNQGLEGLEFTLDYYLRGVPGRVAEERDAVGNKIPFGEKKYFKPQNGYNVYLTIDKTIQYTAERELDRALTKIKASGGTVLVMDPETGDVLAMANRPAYNPNRFLDDTDHWRNIAVSDIYEPGSTFKIITAAAALEEGVVDVNDPFFCKGSIVVSGETIHCWKDGGHGSQTFAQVVENSCNPGFVQVGQRLGAEALFKYVESFGFGKETNIPLPGEGQGIRYALEDIGPVELATLSFGHSISVTPIQLVTAVSAVANDGLLLQPNLVKKVVSVDKETGEETVIEESKPKVVRQVISKETAQLTLQLLGNVVEEGTGVNAQVKGYEIGGKTGTAKHYGAQVYDSSFMGIVPVDDPKLVILVVLYDVTSYPYYGSQTAAPIFQKVAESTLRYLRIPPQQDAMEEKQKKAPKELVIPNLGNQPIASARTQLKQLGFRVKVEGSDSQLVVDQVPKPGAMMPERSTVILFAQDGMQEMRRYQVTVPDLSGMTFQEASELLAEIGLQIEGAGEQGKVKKQIPTAYSRIDSGSKVKIFVK